MATHLRVAGHGAHATEDNAAGSEGETQGLDLCMGVHYLESWLAFFRHACELVICDVDLREQSGRSAGVWLVAHVSSVTPYCA